MMIQVCFGFVCYGRDTEFVVGYHLIYCTHCHGISGGYAGGLDSGGGFC